MNHSVYKINGIEYLDYGYIFKSVESTPSVAGDCRVIAFYCKEVVGWFRSYKITYSKKWDILYGDGPKEAIREYVREVLRGYP